MEFNKLIILIRLQLILGLIIFVSCSKHKPEKSRFDFNSLSLTTYSWRADHKQGKVNFYVARFIEIDSSGHCLVMRKDTSGQPQYYGAVLPTSFDSLINRVNFDKPDSTYTHADEGLLYCGFSYCLMIEKRSNPKKYIRYIPHSVIPEIKNLTDSLDKYSIMTDSIKHDPFDYENTTNYIATKVEDSSTFPRMLKTTIKYKTPGK